jgi:uncharacterized protein (TIGR01244 family)
MKNIVLILIFLLAGGACAEPPLNELVSSGQPTPTELAERADAGFKTVIDLRTEDEPRGFDEPAVVESLGMRYESLPIGGADDLSDANAKALKSLIAESDGPVLVHCGSGNRVGALLSLVARSDGLTIEESITYGRKFGLTSLEPVVRERLTKAVGVNEGSER